MRATLLNVSRVLLLAGLVAAPVSAEVVRIDVQSRSDLAAGQVFGTAGPFEKIAGKIFSQSIQPCQRTVCDRPDKALRNAAGKVPSLHFSPSSRRTSRAATALCSTRCRIAAGRGCWVSSTTRQAVRSGLKWAEMGTALMQQGFTLLWSAGSDTPRVPAEKCLPPGGIRERAADSRAGPERLRGHRERGGSLARRSRSRRIRRCRSRFSGQRDDRAGLG